MPLVRNALPFCRARGIAFRPIALTGANSVDEGSSYSLTLGSVVDPGADTVTSYTIKWGDGSTENFSGSPNGLTKTHTYADGPNNYTITVDLVDEDRAHTGAGSKAVTVNNVAPTIALTGANSVDEGSSYSLTLGSVVDPGTDTVSSYTIKWGDGSTENFSGSPNGLTKTHTYADGPNNYTITVDLVDEDATHTGAGSKAVTVNNVAPTITSSDLNLSAASINENESVTLSGSFIDPGTLDTHIVTIEWGDSSPNTTLNLGAGVLTFAAQSHQYRDDNPTGTASDNYAIKVTVKDKDNDSGNASKSITVDNVAPTLSNIAVTSPINESGTATLTGSVTDPGTYVVVYDPSAGFVTGGGWIQSPAGAYAADTQLTGKANFGFVSKYQKGSNVPTGETEFQLHFATFNFHSTSYQWLVVSGARAQYKGSGKINGAGNYGFLLTATDGHLSGGGGIDKFRIKIWDILTGAIVYDNVPGGSEDIDAANPQAINGGSITIHTPKK